jgi:UDPglucose--hexose-1-phosphate uridylyltransferase
MESTIASTKTITAEQAALAVEQLIQYALHTELLEELDVIAARNALLAELNLAAPYASPLSDADEPQSNPFSILELLLDYAYQEGILPHNTVTYRDLLDTKLMGLLIPRPSEAIRKFRSKEQESGIQAATDYWYKLAIDSCYIRMDRIAKNKIWYTSTPFGELEITINLSKPEKDPKEIALMKNVVQTSYPKCQLCPENVGYAGRLDHPARQNLRVVPLQLDGANWYLQYSPYVYYNEHSIVFSGKHEPMRITPGTFDRLLEFLDSFPHYFVGSNADLPIVGGSILTHDHYQGGRHRFPLQESPIIAQFNHSEFTEVHGGIVKWPLSVVRLASHNREQLSAAATSMLNAWRAYSDPSVGVHAFSGETPHNTITPIARRNEQGEYELDLVLRNNRTDEEHPEGIFHPHRHLHHIKKENIGLIEVMGLAVLPARLDTELLEIAATLTGEQQVSDVQQTLPHHADWIAELVASSGTNLTTEQADEILKREVGGKFLQVLQYCGVFKQTEEGLAAFVRFLHSEGYSQQ